jgi:hypothetical protein
MTTTARPDTMSLMLLPSWRNGHRPNRVLGQRTHSMVRRRCSFHEFAGSVLVTEEGPAGGVWYPVNRKCGLTPQRTMRAPNGKLNAVV